MGNWFSFSISADNTVSRSWDCIASHSRYTCKLEENLKALRQARDRLTELRNDLKARVDIAEEQHLMKRLNQVQGWLSRVEAVSAEADQLINDGPQEINKLCLSGCFSPNCKSSYKFGKAVVENLEAVVNLRSEGDNFKEVTARVPVAQVSNLRPTEPTEGLESTFVHVSSFLRKEVVGIIGIYGMGGVGKTTLLTQIYNELQTAQNRFDVVIWVTVSQDFKFEKLQRDIGEKVGLFDDGFVKKTLEEKAQCIFTVLRKRKFVIILDDIWERVDLIKTGIPLPNEKNGSKLIFSTRSFDVCCQMEAQEKIKVECLTEDDAWELFSKKVGEETLESHPAIAELAKEAMRECDGLPLALITIGRAMASKRTPEAWKYAIDALRRPTSFTFPGMGREVYPKLKFSYDSLESRTHRTCFLYCCLFPEDYQINKHDLIDYWIGEGFLDEYDGQSLTRNQGHFIIGCLVDACLLEENTTSDGDKCVKMHDVIRDMALWIACELEEAKYLVRAGAKLVEVAEVENWDKVKKLSLMGNEIENVRGIGISTCTKVQSLFLRGNRLRVITSEFFQFMPNLKVLDLSKNGILRKIPMGISALVSLEYLNLSSTSIKELPIELKNLSKLKCLNLDWIRDLMLIPQEVVSGFAKLQVFRMYASGFEISEVKDGNILSGGNEWLVEELKVLKHLNSLSITIRSVSALQRFSGFHNLQRCTESICLYDFEDSKVLNVASLSSMEWVQVMWLQSLICLEELKIEPAMIVSKTCFRCLYKVRIGECREQRELTWLLLAPNLKFLRVYHCRKLETIICKEKVSQLQEVWVNPNNPFARLHTFDLTGLPQLKSIYWHALSFPCLTEMFVNDCPMLRKLPFNSESANNQMTIQGAEKWWKNLEWEDDATLDAFLPRFRLGFG